MNKMIWPIAAVVCVAIAATGAVLVAHSLRPAAVAAPRVPRPAAVKHDPSPSPAARRHHARPSKVAPRPARTSTSTSAPASPEPVLLITCTGNGVTEPSSFLLACGDGSAGLSGLTWSSWTASGATGSGEYGVNDCTPDCAQGTFRYTPATVTLSGPVFETPSYFAHMLITDADLPGGSVSCAASVYNGMNCQPG